MNRMWLVAAAVIAAGLAGALQFRGQGLGGAPAAGPVSARCQGELAAVQAAFDRARSAREVVARLQGGSADPAHASALGDARKEDRRSQNALEAALVKGREAGCAMPAAGALEAMSAESERR